MWRSLLPSPVWPLPICLIHGPYIPGSYAILLFTASDLASIMSHIHNWVLFLLWLCLFILSGVISPLISSSILGTYRCGEFILSVLYLFAFSYCSWGSQGKNTEVVCHSLLQWTTFCQNSPPRPIHLGWPHMAWLSFTELDKAVVCMIRLVSFLWLLFLSVCPLMPSLSACHLIGVSLTLDVGYFFPAAPAKHSCCSLPCTWGISSQPPLLALDVGCLLSAARCSSIAQPRNPQVNHRLNDTVPLFSNSNLTKKDEGFSLDKYYLVSVLPLLKNVCKK